MGWKARRVQIPYLSYVVFLLFGAARIVLSPIRDRVHDDTPGGDDGCGWGGEGASPNAV